MAKNVGKKARRAPELASRIRDLLISALDLLEADGVPIDQLLAAEAKQNPFKILEVASKFVPRDLNVTGDMSVSFSGLSPIYGEARLPSPAEAPARRH
jgi:hypothetical protein